MLKAKASPRNKNLSMQSTSPHQCLPLFLPNRCVDWPVQLNLFANYVPIVPGAPLPPFLGTPEKWYEEECKKLDIQNMALLKTIDSLAEECVALKTKLLECGSPDQDSCHRKNRKKRRRRMATEIPRHFQCPTCSKAYG